MRNNLFYEPINYFRVTSLIENYVYLCNCRTTHGELHRVYARIPQHSTPSGPNYKSPLTFFGDVKVTKYVIKL